MTPTGVLCMAYGTPRSLDELEAYYTHIRRGSPPPPDLLAELRARYEAIGGSPLAEITDRQCAALQAALDELHGAGSHLVAQGLKHAAPFIEDGVRALHDAGCERALGIVLAPHFSTLSIGVYAGRAAKAAQELGGPAVDVVESWHMAEGYLSFLEEAVGEALASLPAPSRASATVLFTAHSLPERILAAGDPYPAQLRETAEAVAARAGLERFATAWQSAGRTADPWLGPDVLDVMAAEAGRGAEAIVVCPCGFVADHLEVLYDVDVECAARARELGVAFARTRSPNDEPRFIATLAEVLAGHAARA